MNILSVTGVIGFHLKLSPIRFGSLAVSKMEKGNAALQFAEKLQRFVSIRSTIGHRFFVLSAAVPP